MALFLAPDGQLRIEKRCGVVKSAAKRTPGKSRSRRRDDPEQSKRFIEIAREVEADGTKEEFERAFKRVTSAGKAPKSGNSSPRKSGASDDRRDP